MLIECDGGFGRNGNGPLPGAWCNPPGRGLGRCGRLLHDAMLGLGLINGKIHFEANAAAAGRLGYCRRLCVAARRRDKPEAHRTLVGSPVDDRRQDVGQRSRSRLGRAKINLGRSIRPDGGIQQP